MKTNKIKETLVYDSSTGEVYRVHYNKLIEDISRELDITDKILVRDMLWEATELRPVVFGKYSAWSE